MIDKRLDDPKEAMLCKLLIIYLAIVFCVIAAGSFAAWAGFVSWDFAVIAAAVAGHLGIPYIFFAVIYSCQIGYKQ